jgi:hypothetical protein
MDVDQRTLPFPLSLAGFRRLFPDDAALNTSRRAGETAVYPHCGVTCEPFASRPDQAYWRTANADVRQGDCRAVMERSHAVIHLVLGRLLVASQTPACRPSSSNGSSGSLVTRSLSVLHKLRAGMVADQDRIGGRANDRGGRNLGRRSDAAKAEAFTTGSIACAVRCAIGAWNPRRTSGDGRYAGRVQLALPLT